jgi:hypothetical protein
MEVAIFFAVVGTIWLIFRKGIARRQAQIMTDFAGGGEVPENHAKAWEQAGFGFCILLLVAAVVIGFAALMGNP